MSLGARVRQCRLALGWSQAELARRLGVKQQSVDQLESGRVKSPRYVIELADTLSVPLDWLRHGKGKLRFAQEVSGAAREPGVWSFEATDDARVTARAGSFELDGQSYGVIPIYDGRGAGPLGAASGQQVCARSWLATITAATPGELAVLRVTGDAMAPALADGDQVLVDRSVKRWSRDGLYAVRYAAGDDVMVKRLTRDLSSGLLIVKSDNAGYGAQTAKSDGEITIEGRVIWMSRTLG